MEENKRGGKRLGAGRKPIADKKKLVPLYVEEKKIWSFGNEQKLKDRLYDFIDAEVQPELPIQGLTKPTYEGKKSIPVDDEPLSFKTRSNVVKTAAEYIELKRECETKEQWNKLWEEINNSTLTFKEKQILKTAT